MFSAHAVTLAPSFEQSVNTIFCNIFEEGFYNDYHEQRRRFVLGSLAKKKYLYDSLNVSVAHNLLQELVFELIQLSTRALPGGAFDQAHHHAQFMLRLREAIIEKEAITGSVDSLTRQMIDFINEYTEWMFTAPRQSQASQDFILQTTGLTPDIIHQLFQQNVGQFWGVMLEHFTTIARFGREKISGLLNDPIFHGDTPHYLFSLDNAKNTIVIRTPNPTRNLTVDGQGETLTATLNEEFRNFIAFAAQKQRRHLYINVLGRGGPDNPKAAEIEKLELDPLLSQSLMVVTLDKDKHAAFYCQEGEFRGVNEAEQFKQCFFALLFEEDGRYYWTSKIDLSEWKIRCMEVLHRVHRIYFDGRIELTPEERQDFIELSYVEIIDELAEILQPHVLNVTCKQSVDRGPSVYALLYMHNLIKKKESIDEHLLDLFLLYFSPPLAYHNRIGHDVRVQRFQSAAARLYLCSKELEMNH